MQPIKTAIAAAFTAVTLIATGALAQDKKEITIATEGAFPPYNLTRPDGTLD
ncbi:ABC transporter substrate-binding protein, partial [Caulobacter sp. D4A]